MTCLEFDDVNIYICSAVSYIHTVKISFTYLIKYSAQSILISQRLVSCPNIVSNGCLHLSRIGQQRLASRGDVIVVTAAPSRPDSLLFRSSDHEVIRLLNLWD